MLKLSLREHDFRCKIWGLFEVRHPMVVILYSINKQTIDLISWAFQMHHQAKLITAWRIFLLTLLVVVLLWRSSKSSTEKTNMGVMLHQEDM